MVCKDFNRCSNILSCAVLDGCWCDRGCPLRRWPPWWYRRWWQHIGHHWWILSLQVAWTLLAKNIFRHFVQVQSTSLHWWLSGHERAIHSTQCFKEILSQLFLFPKYSMNLYDIWCRMTMSGQALGCGFGNRGGGFVSWLALAASWGPLLQFDELH